MLSELLNVSEFLFIFRGKMFMFLVSMKKSLTGILKLVKKKKKSHLADEDLMAKEVK